jgi:hypothetical protein
MQLPAVAVPIQAADMAAAEKVRMPSEDAAQLCKLPAKS